MPNIFSGINVKDHGASGNGVANDGPSILDAIAFAKANGNAAVVFPVGQYRISSNLTINHAVLFEAGASLSVSTGFTVSFTVQPEASNDLQIFNLEGTAAISDLNLAKAEWFLGNKIDTSQIANTELQKLANSVRNGGVITFPRGEINLSGSAPVIFSKGQNIRGSGRSATKFFWNGALCEGFLFNGNVNGATISDVGFFNRSDFDIPTIGTALKFESYLWVAHNIMLRGGFIGIFSSIQGKLSSFDINDFRYQGIHFYNHADSYASQGIVTAPSSYVGLTAATGNFSPGESITWSGQNGDIVSIWTNDTVTKAKIPFSTQVPAIGTIVTGLTSGTKAKITSIAHSMQDGSLRISGKGETHLFTDIDFTGGNVIARIVPGVDTWLLNICFENCLFDGARESAVTLERGYGTKFTNCFFSGRVVDYEVYIINSVGTHFVNAQCVNSGGGFVFSGAGAKDTSIIGGHCLDYNTRNGFDKFAVRFGVDTTGTVRDFRIGKINVFPNVATCGICLDYGCKVVIDNVNLEDIQSNRRIQNYNSSTSSNVVVTNCRGYRTKNKGIRVIPNGQTSVTTNHGCLITPNEEDFIIRRLSPSGGSGIIYVTNITPTQFTIVSSAPASGDYYIQWSVEILNRGIE